MFSRIPSLIQLMKIGAVALLLVGSFALISATTPVYTAEDKAYYMDPATVAFVRPGFEIKILSAEVAADGTIKTRLQFTDPKGLPLDRLGVYTPGAISASLIAATIPAGQRQYTAYTTRRQTSPITGVTAVQAGADSGGRWEVVPGTEFEYLYTFATKAPSTIDRTATHTISVYGNRNLTEFGLTTYLDSENFDFVPDGSAVKVTRDVIRTETCNKCHDRLQLHGSTGRTTMPNCVTCHQPQTTDPDTGNTVDLAVMIHKIHRGKFLPSVVAGGKYVIIGNSQSVHDFSALQFTPAPFNTDTAKQCETCHESDKGATQADAWLTHPNRVACGSCHDNVNFATGENHANLPQVSDNQCVDCHKPEGELEFDISIKGAHTTPELSKQLTSPVFEILEVRDGAAGKAPVVTFTLKDKHGAGLRPSDFNSLSLVLAGPASDYSTYVSQDARGAQGSGDRWTYTFTQPIPPGATGTWSVGIEGRRTTTLNVGTVNQMTTNDPGKNVLKYFSVDGSNPEPRRTVVSLTVCSMCHNKLMIHGTLRNQPEHCVTCHNPVTTDAAVRPADKKPDESIDFRTMIHRIHSGEEQGRQYIIYGRGSSVHDYSHVVIPGKLNWCTNCHVNNSQQLPLDEGLLKVTDPRGHLNPVGSTSAACLGCHASVEAASHALVNTSSLGESCAACHGPGKDFSVDNVHAE